MAAPVPDIMDSHCTVTNSRLKKLVTKTTFLFYLFMKSNELYEVKFLIKLSLFFDTYENSKQSLHNRQVFHIFPPIKLRLFLDIYNEKLKTSGSK
jgi:hypothetical protein